MSCALLEGKATPAGEGEGEGGKGEEERERAEEFELGRGHPFCYSSPDILSTIALSGRKSSQYLWRNLCGIPPPFVTNRLPPADVTLFLELTPAFPHTKWFLADDRPQLPGPHAPAELTHTAFSFLFSSPGLGGWLVLRQQWV